MVSYTVVVSVFCRVMLKCDDSELSSVFLKKNIKGMSL